MSPHIKKRLIRTAVLCTIAFAVGAGAAWMQVATKNATVLKNEQTQSGMQVAGLKVGGAFTLLDQSGNTVTEKALEGRYALIYFGFTYCPAICPTELRKITQALKGLERDNPALAEKVLPVFITIDPERDTVAAMKDYASLFHPRLLALTGSVEQIEHVKSLYKVFGRKVLEEGAAADEYTMDHSSYIYLMDPKGTLRSMYRTQDTADVILADLKALPPSP